jgi:DNA polymerase
MTDLSLDYETFSRVDLKVFGLDRYMSDRSTEVLMLGWAFDNDDPQLWLPGMPFPRDVRRAMEDPEVEKWAFNAQFERIATLRLMGIETPYEGWRCTMALAFMQGFSGDLAQIGRLVGLDETKQKLAEGKKLVKMFTMPQKVTKTQPFERLDELTHPREWQQFCEYCPQDVVAERAIKHRLIKYPIPDSEWRLYELDQKINDRGLPIDRQFVENGYAMALKRKDELLEEMREETGLSNPGSGSQLLPWLKQRGYWFGDLQKDTIKKVLTEDEEAERPRLNPKTVRVLKLRQNQSKTSHTKLAAVTRRGGKDDLLRFTFQFAGAQRTQRWAGRGFQPHNLVRTAKKTAKLLEELITAIRENDYETVSLILNEPMTAITQVIRAAIWAPDGYELRVCDLSAIETCVTAWVSGCERLLNVLRNGGDPYKDFGTDLYGKPKEEITQEERQGAKPAVLGCTYRLGGGDLKEGKRTGLWGYAESMGVNQTKAESHRQVRVFRESYPEIPKLWYALEDAVKRCVKERRSVKPFFKIDGRRVDIPVTFEYRAPYLMIVLPNVDPETGVHRRLYYHKPQIRNVTFQGKDGPYKKEVFSYMGTGKNTRAWVRVFSHGGKLTENIVQAIARDVLKEGLMAVDEDEFDIRGHVHDEIITLCRFGDNRRTVERMIELMSRPLAWAPGLPLGAAGYSSPYYKKD